jgi:hypothetical protein
MEPLMVIQPTKIGIQPMRINLYKWSFVAGKNIDGGIFQCHVWLPELIKFRDFAVVHL